MIYVYYAIACFIVLPVIEKLRELRIKNKKPNVNHFVSGLLAVIAAVAIYVTVQRPLISWQLLTYFIACFALRGLLYDGSLNILNRRYYDAVSTTTNAKTDNKLAKLTFWQRRMLYGLLLLITLAVKYFFVK